jgi:hypothetical protein
MQLKKSSAINERALFHAQVKPQEAHLEQQIERTRTHGGRTVNANLS